MSHDHNDVPQDGGQQCFTDFFLASVDQEPNFNTLNFGTAPQDPNMRYPSAGMLQNNHGNVNPIQQHGEIKRIPEELDDNVFGVNGGYFNNQPINHPFVTYTSCPSDPQQPQIMQYTNNGQQMSGQNYDMYNNHTSSPNSADRASISNSPYTPQVRQDYPLSPPNNVSQAPPKAACIPSLSDYPGDNNFEIYFGASTESAVKSAQYTHSVLLGKLFLKMNVLCPIQFRCQKQPPEGSIIRALPVYMRPEHVTEVVTRCPNHQIQDLNMDHLSRHLIRAEQPGNNSVRYGVSQDGRSSVTVLYVPPETGAEYITVFYKYMCLSSCVGGINRRPITTIFTLESPDGVVLGRRCVEVRICSCPGRDRSQEERRKRKPAGSTGYVLLPKKKKPASMPSTSTAPDTDDDEFFLRIKGKEKYQILKKLKEAMDLMELVSPQQKEEYRQNEASAETSIMSQVLKNYFRQSKDGDGNGQFPT